MQDPEGILSMRLSYSHSSHPQDPEGICSMRLLYSYSSPLRPVHVVLNAAMLGSPPRYIFTMFILLVDRPGVLDDGPLQWLTLWPGGKLKRDRTRHQMISPFSALHTDMWCITGNNMFPMQPVFELLVRTPMGSVCKGYV